MNRLAIRREVPFRSAIARARYDDRGPLVKTGGGCHATFAPMHYEDGYGYPLVVWLHSPGGDEQELKRIMPLISLRNFVGVSVRGTVTSGANASGYDWSQNDDHILLAQQRVSSAIVIARRKYHVDSSRVFLAGYQTGGTMAFRLATSQPEDFAGALSVGGEFPTNGAPLSRYDCARKLPLFLASCRDSVKYAEDRVCQDLRLFHAAGIHVTLRQYPCGDELTTNMLTDMDHWMMERIGASTASVVR